MLAAANDDILVAIGNGEQTRCIEAANVARQEPAAGKPRVGVDGGIAIAQKHIGTARRHFPFRTGFNVIAIVVDRSEEHTSELQSLMRISYAVFCLKKKKTYTINILKRSTHSN